MPDIVPPNVLVRPLKRKGKRRLGVLVLLASTLAALLIPSGATVAGSGSPGGGERPNVLIIVTDDQRVDTLDVMPATREWLGAGGRTFTNAFATTPLCCPSRASILTGNYAHNHGVKQNELAPRIEDARTMPEALQGRGYLTGIAGKFFNEWDLSQPPPSFDRWALFKEGYPGAWFNIEGEQLRIDRYTTDFVRDTSVEMLRSFEQDDQRPWFLYVAPFAPHTPAIPAPQDRRAPTPTWYPSPAVGEEDRSDKPPFVQDRRAQGMRRAADMRVAQLRTLMSVDRMVGELSRTLSGLEEESRTLVIFVSDNGYFWGEHGLHAKSLPYLETSKVPLLVRWPGHVQPGSTDGRLVANVDIAPTVMQAAGATGEQMDGRYLLGPDVRDRILLEYWDGGTSERIPTWASLTTSSVQYVEYYTPNGKDVVFQEYYDLASDPWQMTNLLGDADYLNDPSDEAIAALAQQLDTDRRCRGTGGPAACP